MQFRLDFVIMLVRHNKELANKISNSQSGWTAYAATPKSLGLEKALE